MQGLKVPTQLPLAATSAMNQKKYKIDEITICSGLKKENVTTKSTPCNLLHRENTHNISTFVTRTICIF